MTEKTARPPLILLIIMTAIGPMALNMFMPSMPGMQEVFDVEYEIVQLTLTFYLAAIAVSQLFFGPISDRFGRRPTVIAGLLCFVLGTIICLFAWSIWSLIIGRIIQGFGGASGLVLGRAMIRDVYSRDKSASMIGYVTMAMVLAPMFSPLIGGVLDVRYGWQSSFLVLLLCGFVTVVLVAMFLPETNRHLSDRAGFGPLVEGAAVLVRSPCFLAYTATMSFASASFFSFLAAAPVIVIDIIGHTPADYGRYFMIGAVGYMTGNFISGRFSERLGADTMIGMGNILGLTGATLIVSLAWFAELTALSLFGPLFILAMSNGMVLPNATAAAVSVRPDLAGAGAGIAGSAQLSVGALATVIVTALTNGTQFPLVYAIATTMTLATIAHFFARRALRSELALTPQS
ncbi:MAG: multidrug effflux MFS transporter [Pseudomonadota bacterium]